MFFCCIPYRTSLIATIVAVFSTMKSEDCRQYNANFSFFLSFSLPLYAIFVPRTSCYDLLRLV